MARIPRKITADMLTDDKMSLKGKHPVGQLRANYTIANGHVLKAGTRGRIGFGRSVKQSDHKTAMYSRFKIGTRIISIVFPYEKGMEKLWADGMLLVLPLADIEIIGRVDYK